MLESELGLLWLRAGRVGEAKGVVESGKLAVEELQVGYGYIVVVTVISSHTVILCV